MILELVPRSEDTGNLETLNREELIEFCRKKSRETTRFRLLLNKQIEINNAKDLLILNVKKHVEVILDAL